MVHWVEDPVLSLQCLGWVAALAGLGSVPGLGTSTCLGYGKKKKNHTKKQPTNPKLKLKIELPYDPVIPLQDIYPEKAVIQKNNVYPNVHSSTIHNSQDMKAT